MIKLAREFGALQALSDFYKLSQLEPNVNAQGPAEQIAQIIQQLPNLKRPGMEDASWTNRLDAPVMWSSPLPLGPEGGSGGAGRGSEFNSY